MKERIEKLIEQYKQVITGYEDEQTYFDLQFLHADKIQIVREFISYLENLLQKV